MSNLGFVLDTPLADLTVRDGDTDPIDFTLKSNDAVIDLTGQTVEMRIRATRGDQAAQVFTTTDVSPKLVVVSPATNGVVRFTPTTTTFTIAGEIYRIYFNIITGGTHRSIPQGQDIWLRVLPKF